MPSGHASHKGSSDKPNTNAAGQLDDAADKTLNPAELLPEGPDVLRADEEAPENAAATQRPGQEDK